ncbi:hypothetical protein [Nitrospira moscoviensis]|uniref:Ferritin-like domain-containing protein n=1 Tax=Nitrospira moscoviensis TaxID=42253 RepID=A0A0K2GA45_NITMO|nr:hypothetical protein [Nitrospira moscoviensis]ALA57447.1 hypothetical protein NITMOv2_1015 [Nitrospira moscoviensis]
MLIRPDEQVPIARLLTFLEYGERLAHDCAAKQAALVDEAGAARFLNGQARQERLHACVFQGAIAWLAPRHLGAAPFLPALEEYRRKLDDRLSRRDLYETFLAEQIILEGLGEAILHRIEAGLVKRGAPFGRLRRVLLHQEEAHHAFGLRMIERGVAAGRADRDRLRHAAQEYLDLTHRMVLTLADLFSSIHEDPAAWAGDVNTYVPAWLACGPLEAS